MICVQMFLSVWSFPKHRRSPDHDGCGPHTHRQNILYVVFGEAARGSSLHRAAPSCCTVNAFMGFPCRGEGIKPTFRRCVALCIGKGVLGVAARGVR
jgi:hypothetical protein